MSENSTRIKTGKVRFCYVKVFKPEQDDSGKNKYKVCILIDKKDKKTIKAIQAAIDAATEKGVAEKWGGKTPKNLAFPLRDGDEEKDGDEFKNCYFINASTTMKPTVIDADGEELDAESFYSGCYGKAIINFFAYDNKGKKGVGCGLGNILKIEDGERLGGGSSDAYSDFDDEIKGASDLAD